MANGSRKQITHVCVSGTVTEGSEHESIKHVKWLDNGSTYTVSRADVVKAIEAGDYVYVKVGSAETRVVPYELNGRKYIRTTRDQTLKDNLLSLPSGC